MSNTYTIGLVGGIASGKTYVAKILDSKFNIPTINADHVAAQVIQRHEVLEKIFNIAPDVFLDNNDYSSLNKKKLSDKIFTHPKIKTQIETIMHPLILDEIKKNIALADLISIDAPLLFECGLDNLCDSVLFVDCPLFMRKKRVIERSWDSQEIFRRESTQIPLDEKRERAHYVLKNNGNCSNDELVANILLFLNECLPSKYKDFRNSL